MKEGNVSEWFARLRDVCRWYNEVNPYTVGGPGLIVEIDEAAVNKRLNQTQVNSIVSVSGNFKEERMVMQSESDSDHSRFEMVSHKQPNLRTCWQTILYVSFFPKE